MHGMHRRKKEKEDVSTLYNLRPAFHVRGKVVQVHLHRSILSRLSVIVPHAKISLCERFFLALAWEFT